jgi:hypothetical protein
MKIKTIIAAQILLKNLALDTVWSVAIIPPGTPRNLSRNSIQITEYLSGYYTTSSISNSATLPPQPSF